MRKHYKLLVKSTIDDYSSADIRTIAMGLGDTLNGQIIDSADLATFAMMLTSLIEEVDIDKIELSKSEDEENYIWRIYYKEDGALYYTSVLAELTEDVNTSFLDTIMHDFHSCGLVHALGVNYKYYTKSNENGTDE